MNNIRLTILLSLVFSLTSCSQSKQKIEEDFDKIYNDLSYNYIYLKDKHVDMDCIKKTYKAKIKSLKGKDDILLYFEYLLDEFYDNHVNLNTNIRKSYRLYAPIYTLYKDGKVVVESAWISRLSEPLPYNIIGAEILSFNGMEMHKMIDAFPTSCNDKTKQEVRQWIANKILSGRYTEPRNLELKLKDGQIVSLNLDDLKYNDTEGLLSVRKEGNIGIIRIHNSLGENQLISAFDKALEGLMDTDGLILDLRNTIGGGNTYVARGVMSRLVSEPKPYQKHWTYQSFSNQPLVERSWVEYVSPRGTIYTKPIIVLSNRWTGSMGEGMTVGFDGMERAEIVGTEMAKLVGSMWGYEFKHRDYKYQLSAEKMHHVNGTLREDFVPEHLVIPQNVNKDFILEKGLNILNERISQSKN